MPSVVPVRGRIPGFVFVCFVLGLLAACGGEPPMTITHVCDPKAAHEVWTINIQNIDQESLRDYAVEIQLDDTNVDFSVPSTDGSDLAVWDSTTRQPMSAWVESYDPVVGKALLWVKLPALDPQTSRTLLLTAGPVKNCLAASLDGSSVFPFFSDVNDVHSWRASDGLSVTDTMFQGPLAISGRSLIESDGTYNGFPGVAQASNGDFVLSYKKGPSHVNSNLVVIRRSSDAGATWSPEVIYFDSSQPDPILIQTPQGALLIALGKADPNGNVDAAYSRSTDNALTWAPYAFFGSPATEVFIVAPSVSVGPLIYGAGYGPNPIGTGDTPSLWLSSDDGFTWSKLSNLRQLGEPDLNETAIAQTAPSTLFAMMRAGNLADTYGRYSDDMGLNWGPLLPYRSEVGVLQSPQMVQAGVALILMGRETLGIPGVQPANTTGYPRQLVAFVSYDGGQTFGYGTVLDTYTGQQIDGGYCSAMVLPSGQVYVVYYADSHNLQKPDIKALMLAISSPTAHPAEAIHVLSRIALGTAVHAMDLDVTRYALEFRFRSSPTPAGSQFSVVLQGQVSGLPWDLVNWELPSTHAVDPTSYSGIISNQQSSRS